MLREFIIKNSEGKKLGKIIYSGKKFEVDVSDPKEKKHLEELLDAYLPGIRDLGEAILKEPIKPDDPLFLGEVQNQLMRVGYTLLIKKEK